jgi:hypothetical protein
VVAKWLVALALVMGVSVPSTAIAEARIALIIGNAEYSGSLSPLSNPVNDAALMEDTLEAVGFEVISVRDASQKEMKRAIGRFGAAIASGGADVTALFYYAGHGLQVDGTNYLVPVTAEIEQEGDVDLESVPAESVLSQMEHAGAKTSIVILDACRNNPLSRSFRSATRGLARMETPNGSFLAYSTAPGDVAADGDGRNSPFAKALAAEMLKPNQAIEETFRNVRIKVMQETQQKQTPWDSSSMLVPFYFVAPTSKAVASIQPIQQAEPVPAPEPASVAVATVEPAPLSEPEAPASKSAAGADIVSPMPDGTIVLSHEVARELDLFLAKVAGLEPATNGAKVAFFYVSQDGRASGQYTCQAHLLEEGDCPRGDIASGSPSQSRQRALTACEKRSGGECVLLYQAEKKQAEYQTVN